MIESPRQVMKGGAADAKCDRNEHFLFCLPRRGVVEWETASRTYSTLVVRTSITDTLSQWTKPGLPHFGARFQ